MRRWYLRDLRINESLSRERKHELRTLTKKLNIRVRTLSFLDRALTHSSCRDKNGKSKTSYERLEFLGDSVLNASVSYLLFQDNPRFKEGRLSAYRSSLVDEKTLAEIGEELGIVAYFNLGRGEKLTDSRARRKVTADIVESIIGVLFIERGFNYAYRFVTRIVRNHLDKRLMDGTRDYKTRLQQLSIDLFKTYPVYEVIGESGPDHNKVFEVQVTVNNTFKAIGTGRSKKESEQKAAQKVLGHMRNRIKKGARKKKTEEKNT